MDLQTEEIESRKHAEMKAGDVVFFHPELIHGSGVNTRSVSEAESDISAFRHAISVHYRRKDAPFVDISAGQSVPAGKSVWDDAPDGEVFFLGSEMAKQNGITTREQAKAWIKENRAQFAQSDWDYWRWMQIDAD